MSNYGSDASKRAHDAFYDHKRDLHSGAYDARCSTCRELWAELVAASQAKAGVR